MRFIMNFFQVRRKDKILSMFNEFINDPNLLRKQYNRDSLFKKEIEVRDACTRRFSQLVALYSFFGFIKKNEIISMVSLFKLSDTSKDIILYSMIDGSRNSLMLSDYCENITKAIRVDFLKKIEKEYDC